MGLAPPFCHCSHCLNLQTRTNMIAMPIVCISIQLSWQSATALKIPISVIVFYLKIVFFKFGHKSCVQKSKYCADSEKFTQIGDMKSPIGHNITNWELGIYLSGNAESENKSPIPNCRKYSQLEIC